MDVFEPDAAWVDRLGRRDKSAVRDFVDGFGPALLTFLARLAGSRADAEDLFQEVCLRVLDGLGRYQHAGRFRAWIFAIAANAARDHARRRRPPPAGAGRGSAPAADRIAAARETLARMDAAVERLPEVQREVFLLRMHSGLTFREIAEVLACPLNTVLGRMHDAIERLRGEVGEA
jgi:RNA polymerase sigma-70 factor (ECF subfamily)